MKKVLALALSLALIATMAISTTVAYLTSEDSDVNTMTLGNVKIEQHEYERAKNDDGTLKTDTIDGKTSYVLKDFTQGKPLLPTTEVDANGNPYNFGAGDWDSTTVRMSQVDSYGGMQVFQSKNAQDKFVTVENTGKSDAYVRTIIAFEIGKLTVDEYENVVRMSSFLPGQVWSINDIGVVEIDGNNYYVSEYLYNGAKALGGVHENGVLPKGETTYPSLAQVYMTATATNEDVEDIDGNGNGTYDILVLSQAVQTAGFDTAEAALDTAFGEANAENAAEWFEEVYANYLNQSDTEWYDASATEYTLKNHAELRGFANLVNSGNNFSGKTVKLSADINLGGVEWTPIGQTGNSYGATAYFQGNFDGQGHTISNMTISKTNDGGDYAAGFFGFLDCGQTGTIKNIKFDGAKVAGHHWTGVVAGYLSGNLENCHVTNSTVTCTHANDEACGDKAGAVVGYINGDQGKVTGCTASNSTVTAGRDAGQVVGTAKETQVVDCSATNVTVSATGDCTGANIRNEVIGRLMS